MAKISKEAIEFVQNFIKEKHLVLTTIYQDEYVNKGRTNTRFLFDVFNFVDVSVRQQGKHSCLFAGTEDQTSWKNESMFIFQGEIKDTHIETAMRSVVKGLGVNLK